MTRNKRQGCERQGCVTILQEGQAKTKTKAKTTNTNTTNTNTNTNKQENNRIDRIYIIVPGKNFERDIFFERNSQQSQTVLVSVSVFALGFGICLRSGTGFGLGLGLGTDEHANEYSGDTREDQGCSF